MEKFIKGDIVVIPFPFSDLSGAKKRPAAIISNLEGNDLILCQVTSKNINDRYSIEISDNDFEKGGLKQQSNIRPNKIFTADEEIVLYKIGRLKEEKIKEITGKILEIFS